MIGMQASERNGKVVGAVQVSESDEIMLISDKGTLVRTRVDEVSVQGRNTQGVRLIRLRDGETLVGLEQVDEPDVEEDLSEHQKRLMSNKGSMPSEISWNAQLYSYLFSRKIIGNSRFDCIPWA